MVKGMMSRIGVVWFSHNTQTSASFSNLQLQQKGSSMLHWKPTTYHQDALDDVKIEALGRIHFSRALQVQSSVIIYCLTNKLVSYKIVTFQWWSSAWIYQRTLLMRVFDDPFEWAFIDWCANEHYVVLKLGTKGLSTNRTNDITKSTISFIKWTSRMFFVIQIDNIFDVLSISMTLSESSSQSQNWSNRNRAWIPMTINWSITLLFEELLIFHGYLSLQCFSFRHLVSGSGSLFKVKWQSGTPLRDIKTVN